MPQACRKHLGPDDLIPERREPRCKKKNWQKKPHKDFSLIGVSESLEFRKRREFHMHLVKLSFKIPRVHCGRKPCFNWRIRAIGCRVAAVKPAFQCTCDR